VHAIDQELVQTTGHMVGDMPVGMAAALQPIAPGLLAMTALVGSLQEDLLEGAKGHRQRFFYPCPCLCPYLCHPRHPSHRTWTFLGHHVLGCHLAYRASVTEASNLSAGDLYPCRGLCHDPCRDHGPYLYHGLCHDLCPGSPDHHGGRGSLCHGHSHDHSHDQLYDCGCDREVDRVLLLHHVDEGSLAAVSRPPVASAPSEHLGHFAA